MKPLKFKYVCCDGPDPDIFRHDYNNENFSTAELKLAVDYWNKHDKNGFHYFIKEVER